MSKPNLTKQKGKQGSGDVAWLLTVLAWPALGLVDAV